MGTSVSLPAVREIWSRHFASAARNADLHFMGRLLNRIGFCAFICCLSKMIIFFRIFFTAENWQQKTLMTVQNELTNQIMHTIMTIML